MNKFIFLILVFLVAGGRVEAKEKPYFSHNGIKYNSYKEFRKSPEYNKMKRGYSKSFKEDMKEREKVRKNQELVQKWNYLQGRSYNQRHNDNTRRKAKAIVGYKYDENLQNHKYEFKKNYRVGH